MVFATGSALIFHFYFHDLVTSPDFDGGKNDPGEDKNHPDKENQDDEPVQVSRIWDFIETDQKWRYNEECDGQGIRENGIPDQHHPGW